MHAAQFPASAAHSLIEGYCEEFFSLATLIAETLEEVNARDIDLGSSQSELERVKSGMRELTEAIELTLHPTQGRGGCVPTTPAATSEEQATTKSSFAILGNTPPVPNPPAKAKAARPSTKKAAASKPDTHATTSAAQPQQPPALKGNNSAMPMRAVFQFLERVRKSGVMTVELPDETLTFGFDGGYVQACETTNYNKGDLLGDLLRDSCDPGQLRNVLLSAKPQNNVQIGEVIVQAGLTTNGLVMNALETQVRGRFERACNAANATYEFIDRPADYSDGRIRIAPMELSFKSGI